jgi:hypothetical protein
MSKIIDISRKLNLIVIALIFISTGCATHNKPKGFDYGKIEKNIYLNSFFRIEMEIPQGWAISSKQQNKRLRKLGEKIFAGDDKSLKTLIDANSINTAYLLTVFRYALGTPVDFNHSFMLVAENLRQSPGVKKASDYLFHARRLMKQSKLKYNIDGGMFEKAVIDGQDFYIMKVYTTYMGMRIYQRYYSTIKNGFSINFIMSYTKETAKQELFNVLNTLKFIKD